jgi:hypothetical protein
MRLRKEFLIMQIKEECKNCTKSRIKSDGRGNVVFGCQEPFCIFEPIVENPFRDGAIEAYKDGGKNS